MPDLQEIYEQHADQYELLASREDYQGNILRTLQEIRSLAGLDVVDLGAGTGRLTCLLAPIVRSIHAVDSSAHMLEVATAKLQKSGLHNWQVHVADHRRPTDRPTWSSPVGASATWPSGKAQHGEMSSPTA